MKKSKDIKENTNTDETLQPAQSVEEPQDDDNATIADVAQAVKDIYGECRNAYRAASPKDKAKLLVIVMPLFVTFIIGFVGIFLANIGQSLTYRTLQTVGFILMGVGLGGFFLSIVLILVINKIKGNI